jgi:hypothetical protein
MTACKAPCKRSPPSNPQPHGDMPRAGQNHFAPPPAPRHPELTRAKPFEERGG